MEHEPVTTYQVWMDSIVAKGAPVCVAHVVKKKVLRREKESVCALLIYCYPAPPFLPQ